MKLIALKHLDFLLHIKLINTKKPQITVINNSSTFDSTALTQHISSENPNKNSSSSSSSETYFHLNFQASTKFIDIRRKLNMLTKIFANNQEWYYYITKNSQENNNDNLDETLTTLKTCNDLSSFHSLLEESKLFALPLTSLFEDSKSLGEMKKTIDELTGESSSNSSAIASSSSSSSSTSSNPINSKYINSKLTPPSASIQSKTLTGSKAASTSATAASFVQMIFIVTPKILNHESSSDSYNHQNHEFNRPHDIDASSFSHARVPLGFEVPETLFMNSGAHGTSLASLNPKKAKINENATGECNFYLKKFRWNFTCLLGRPWKYKRI